MQFMYEGKIYKTAVKDDAGLKATYDDVFLLENVEEQARSGKDLVIQACDHDVGCSSLLGEMNALSLTSLCSTEDTKEHLKDIFHNFKKSGFIKFRSRFIYQPPDPPPNPLLNPFCLLEVLIVKAQFLKDADLMGKQDPYIQFTYNG